MPNPLPPKLAIRLKLGQRAVSWVSGLSQSPKTELNCKRRRGPACDLLKAKSRLIEFMRFYNYALTGACLCLISALCGAQDSWTTRSYDNARTGANLSENTLTTSNVNANSFGKLFERNVDGQVYAQPLYVPNLSTPNKGVHNVVFVATMNDSVYAFDADDPNSPNPLWHTSFLGPGVTPVPYTDVAGTTKDVYPMIGIVSTPVIKTNDSGGGTIYVTAKTKETSGNNVNYVYRLHALDILTGLEQPGSPVVIQPSVPSNASDSVNGVLTFNAKKHMQRPGLLLLNNVVYLAFASHADRVPYHGWVVGYNADTLQQAAVYCATANTGYGGIWQSGQGLSADDDGNIYAITGNAVFDTSEASFGDSFLKLSTASGLSLISSFTPYDDATLNSADLDLGTSGAILMPGTNLVVGGGKQGIIYALNRSALGGHGSSSDTGAVQTWPGAKGHIHGSVVFWTGPGGQMLYVWAEFDKLKAFLFSNGLFNTTPAFQSAMTAPTGMPGGILTVSANGSIAGTGIVWATLPLVGDANSATVPGVLRAFDASNLKELWNSRQVAVRDDLGNFAKFNPPTVVNGKVYVGTFGADDGSSPSKLVCYGLLPSPTAPPVAPAALTATAGNAQVSLTWTSSSTASSYKLFRGSSPGGPYTSIKTGIPTTTWIDSGLTNGSTYYYVVAATNSIGDSGNSNEAAATPGSLAAVYRVNCGSGAFTPFAADAFFTNGSSRVVTTPVDTSGVLDPAPADVYRSERYGPCNYSFASLTAGGTYLVRLHFAETDWYSAGQRLIDVSINGTPVLTGFDIVAAAGGPYKACVREFAGQADGSGVITVSFAANANSPDRNPRIDGIEVLAGSGSVPGAATLWASPGDSSVNLFWSEIPGATSYNLYRSLTAGAEGTTPYATNLKGSSWTDPSCSNGTTYFYELKGVGSGGTGPSSDEASATPSPTSGFSLGASPSSESIVAGTAGNVTVTVTGASGFSGVVGFSVTGMPAGVTASFAPPTVTGSGSSMLTLSVGSAVPSGSYPLTITGTSGALLKSAPFTLNVPASVLLPPSTLTAGGGNTEIFLNWSAVSGANSYNVWRSLNSKGPFTSIQNVGGTSYTDKGLTNGTRYYYAITSVNTSGESGLSTVVTAMPRSILTVLPTADAYVQAGSLQNTNFGAASTLAIKRVSNTGSNGLNRCTYLKLDLTGVTSAPSSALLVMPINSSTTPRTGSASIQIYQVATTSWTEGAITWANAPGLTQSTFASTGTLVLSSTIPLGGTSYSFDITSFVAANMGNVVTLQLVDPNIDGIYTVFNSRESSPGPQLKISWAVQP